MKCLTNHPMDLRLSCANGSHTGDTWRFTICDVISGDQIAEIELPYAAISDLLATRTANGARLVHWNPESILTSRERKTVNIKVPNGLYTDKAFTDPSVVKQLAAIEVDGWKAYRADITNHHRGIGYGETTHTQIVSCSRRVPLTPKALRERVTRYNEFRLEKDQIPAEQVEKWCAELEATHE